MCELSRTAAGLNALMTAWVVLTVLVGGGSTGAFVGLGLIYPPRFDEVNVGGGPKPERAGLTIRVAFWIASSKVRPMAITSPTLFIADPILLSTRVPNFLRSQRGTLTTQ